MDNKVFSRIVVALIFCLLLLFSFQLGYNFYLQNGVAWEDSYAAGYFAGQVRGRATSVDYDWGESSFCHYGIYSKELCACANKYQLPENFKKFCVPIYEKDTKGIE